MVHTISTQGNTEQNQSKPSPHPTGAAVTKKITRMWKEGSPCTQQVGGYVSTAIVEDNMEAAQKVKNRG